MLWRGFILTLASLTSVLLSLLYLNFNFFDCLLYTVVMSTCFCTHVMTCWTENPHCGLVEWWRPRPGIGQRAVEYAEWHSVCGRELRKAPSFWAIAENQADRFSLPPHYSLELFILYYLVCTGKRFQIWSSCSDERALGYTGSERLAWDERQIVGGDQW